MPLLDLTSGGRSTYVLGPAHPALLAARDAATPAAASALRAALEEATGLTLLSWHESCDAARDRAVAVPRARTGRAMVVACRGARVEPGARLVAHGDALQTRKALEGETAAAFLVEVVQVTGGVRVPPPGYLERVRETCSELG